MWQGVYLLYPQEAMRMPVPVLWIVSGSPKLWERHQRLCPEHCRQLAGSAQQMLSDKELQLWMHAEHEGTRLT